MTSYQSVQTKQTSVSGQAHIIQNDAEALEVAKQFAEQFKKTAVERDAKRILPYTEIDALSQSGLWAITVPKQYGGAEVSSHTVAKVIALLSGADGSIGQIPQNHFYALEVLRNTGTEAQKQRLYGEVLNGTRFGNALAEFKTKTSTHKQTNIRPHENGYLIQGEKFYCTGSLFAHRIPTLVLDDAGREYLAFVKSGSQGLKLVDDWSGFGQRTTASGTVELNQVPVREEYLVPIYQAFERPTPAGAISQFIQAAVDAGIARGAIEETIQYVKNHSRAWIDSGLEKASDDPYTIANIGDLKIKLRAAEAVLDLAADAIDQAIADTTEEHVNQATLLVAEAKVLTTEIAILAANKLFELSGTRSTLSELNLDRHWRNARTHTLHDPVRWKYHIVGNYYLNGVQPPRHAWS